MMLRKERSPAKKYYKKHINTKILFWFLLVNILMMIITNFFVYVTMSDKLIDMKFEELRSIKDMAKKQLLTDIHEHVDHIKTIANTPLIVDVLLGNASAENSSAYLRKINSIHKEGDMHIVDLNGTIISSTASESVGQSIADRKYFQKVMSGLNGFAGLYRQQLQPGVFYLITYASVVQASKAIGAVMFLSELEHFTHVLASEAVRIGETGETYIVGIRPQPEPDSQEMYTYKTMITISRFDDPGEDIAYGVHIVDTEAVNECIKGNSSVKIIKDYRGVSVLSAYTPIEELGWCIISEIDEDEALSGVALLRRQLILIGVGVLAVAIIISVLVAKSITAPIRKLHGMAEEIAAGNLDYMIDIETGDEIEQLADEFNLMNTKLKEFYSNLEEKVFERTKELEEANEEFRSLVEGSSDIIMRIDRDGKILFINSFGAESMWKKEDFLGKTLYDFMLSEDHESIKRTLERAFDHGEHGRYECTVPSSDGSPLSYECRVGPIKIGGKVSAGILIASNITEYKQMIRAKDEFISVVSHELRTPLTSIHASLGLLAGGAAGELAVQVEELLDIAYRNSDRLVRLINDILDVEKFEAGKMEFHFQPQKMMPLVEQAIESNQAYAERFGVKLVLEDTLPDAEVNVDADRLMQALTNLLSNAAKFSPPDDEVLITVSRQGRAICVAIADHGPGIPVSFRSRLFEKFAQADTSDRRQKSGTGLGLSIAKAIAEVHSGKLSFETEINVGTTFYLDLPEWHESHSITDKVL